MIAYDRYTEYLSQQIYQTITPTIPSLFQVSDFSISADLSPRFPLHAFCFSNTRAASSI